jgi:hypothetical protein
MNKAIAAGLESYFRLNSGNEAWPSSLSMMYAGFWLAPPLVKLELLMHKGQVAAGFTGVGIQSNYSSLSVITLVSAGALREVRRDAAFMAEVRDRERAKVDAERFTNEKR